MRRFDGTSARPRGRAVKLGAAVLLLASALGACSGGQGRPGQPAPDGGADPCGGGLTCQTPHGCIGSYCCPTPASSSSNPDCNGTGCTMSPSAY